MPPYMDIYKPEYTTFCGCHVRKFALFIGYFALIMAIFNTISSGASGFWYYIPANVIAIVCYVFLILAHYKENPSYYFPYLIITGLSLLVTPLLIIFFVVLLSAGYRSIIDTDYNESTFRTILIIFIFVLVIAEIVQLYFWIVVKRAKNYMESEVCTGNVHRQQYSV
uniref:Uncharacterized protein n=1 Tax=Panagrolaimus sp. JU765 TaxID=591449 RepID=A0AC34PYR3_9BILA